MNISPGDEVAVNQSRDFARKAAKRALRKNLGSAFVGSAFLTEAMILLLKCERERAEALANGLLVLAVADQQHFLAGGDVAASLSRVTAELLDAVREYAGFAKS